MSISDLNIIEIEKKTADADPLKLSDRISLISLLDEGIRQNSPNKPVLTGIYKNLWDLVDITISGAKINRLNPSDSSNGFHAIELNSSNGDNLGRLNMLYLKKPIPCYYLVYVEVAPFFRQKGLGNIILEHFRTFLDEKGALGILDNIIPKEDPSYSIYFKQAWEPAEWVVGNNIKEDENNYMIYIPANMKNKSFKQPVMKLLHHLRRKRAVIDMRDNEMMVKKTISEFQTLYKSLLTYFKSEIATQNSSPFMRYMFTRYISQLIAFRQNIGELIGYTGGESMEQFELLPEIKGMEVRTYLPDDLACDSAGDSIDIRGSRKLCSHLVGISGGQPAKYIESLHDHNVYQPLDIKKSERFRIITIGELMESGQDPSRLKDITIDKIDYVFERVQGRQLFEIENRLNVFEDISISSRIDRVPIKLNRIKLLVKDMGNAYVLRKKINAIPWDEALEYIKRDSGLIKMDDMLSISRLIITTIRKVKKRLNQIMEDELKITGKAAADGTILCISWDVKANKPLLYVDFNGVALETIWIV